MSQRLIAPLTPPTGFRPDIEGLRALAVTLVVLDHLFRWPSAGFIGVDVFFVISGFLITGLLLKEHERTSRISFSGFYRRRARRILPAAAAVLVATCVAAHYLLIGERARQTYGDALWSLIFGANWHFASVGTDYFQREVPPSPLQHYWSLAVEEQFYVVWPWLVLLVLSILVRRRAGIRACRTTLAIMVATVTAASFAWAIVQTQSDGTSAYFSTFTRIWQLGLGALLSLFAYKFATLRPGARATIGVAGVAMILMSAVLLDSGSGFPGPWGAAPVLGSALVIAAGVSASHYRYMPLLVNPVAGYLGRISYSWYLWHWPVIVLLAAVLPSTTSPRFYLYAGVGGLLLAMASHRLIEKPVMDSGWLLGAEAREAVARKKKRKAVARKKKRQGRRVGRYQDLGLAALGFVTVTMSVMVLRSPAAPPVDTVTGTSTVASTSSVAATAPAPAAVPLPAGEAGMVQQAVREALLVQKWPELRPGPDNFDALPADRVDFTKQCVAVAPSGCAPGSGEAGTAFVIGDSMARQYSYTIAAALVPRGWKVEKGFGTACPVINTTLDLANADECTGRRAEIMDRIRSEKPDLIFIASNYFYVTALASGAKGDAADVEWKRAFADLVAVAKGTGAKVVALAAPPAGLGKDPKKCITKFNDPKDCQFSIPEYWPGVAAAEAQASAEAGTVFIETSGWFCGPEKVCPSFADGKLIRFDQVHLTIAYAEYLAPTLVERLVAAKVLPA
jgi:peptidoglycan/LPS O-acetylase OafA/YrhL